MKLIVLAILPMLFLGCTYERYKDLSDDANQKKEIDVVTFAVIQRFIIEVENCTGCHSGAAPAAGLNLGVYEAILDKDGIVLPENAEDSRLYQALDSGFMPPSGKLNQERIDLVKEWIEQGALP